jgi:dTDP-4-amino-4,6-dideoxy-D-glucose acyltransferase
MAENIFFNLKDLAHLGRGAIVGKCVRVRRPELVRIGDHTIIDDFTYIAGTVEIGRYGHIAPNVLLSGGRGKIHVGDFVGVAAGSCVYATTSNYLDGSFDLPSIPAELQFGLTTEDVVLGDNVLLGCHTVVLPGVVLPEGVATAAHTVLRKKDYKPWTLYAGLDAKPLARRDHKQLAEALARLKAMEPREPSPAGS